MKPYDLLLYTPHSRHAIGKWVSGSRPGRLWLQSGGNYGMLIWLRPLEIPGDYGGRGTKDEGRG